MRAVTAFSELCGAAERRRPFALGCKEVGCRDLSVEFDELHCRAGNLSGIFVRGLAGENEPLPFPQQSAWGAGVSGLGSVLRISSSLVCLRVRVSGAWTDSLVAPLVYEASEPEES